MKARANPAPKAPTSAIARAASTWLVRRRAGLSADDKARFQQWLQEDPRHAAAMSEVEGAWDVLAFPAKSDRTSDAARLLAAHAQRRSRRRRAFIAAGGLAAGIALALVVLPGRFNLFASSSPTVVVRPNKQTLPDGSIAELNAGAEIRVQYSTEARRIQLVRGEALFTVEKNSTQPFIVAAPGVEVRAIGTTFSVRNDPRQIGVLVTEGRVSVELAATTAAPESAVLTPPRQPPVLIGAGEQVVVSTGPAVNTPLAVETCNPSEIAAALAWREHRIEFTRTPLAEAVTLLNKKNQLQVAIGDADLGRVLISGIFWADDPEGFCRLLGEGFDLLTERAGNTLTLRSQRP